MRTHLLSLTAVVLSAMSAFATGLLPERVENAAQERIAAGTYQTLVFGVAEGDKSEVVAFGKLDDGKAPDGDAVYEIGSVTKTFTATLLAQLVLSGRVTLDTPVAQLLRGASTGSLKEQCGSALSKSGMRLRRSRRPPRNSRCRPGG
jgi:CubicO group peptidase (beta-lactamase class C family)